jgi:hypothetical protein
MLKSFLLKPRSQRLQCRRSRRGIQDYFYRAEYASDVDRLRDYAQSSTQNRIDYFQITV